MKGFELLEHTADMGLRVWAYSRESFYQEAAAGLNAIMTVRLPAGPVQRKTIVLIGEDEQELLVHFLNELIYEATVHHMIAGRIKVEQEEQGHELTVDGSFAILGEGTLVREIKSATYHQLKVSVNQGKWEGEVYFDL